MTPTNNVTTATKQAARTAKFSLDTNATETLLPNATLRVSVATESGKLNNSATTETNLVVADVWSSLATSVLD